MRVNRHLDENRNDYKVLVGKPEGHNFELPEVHKSVIWQWTLNRLGGVAGLIWLRKENNGGSS